MSCRESRMRLIASRIGRWTSTLRRPTKKQTNRQAGEFRSPCSGDRELSVINILGGSSLRADQGARGAVYTLKEDAGATICERFRDSEVGTRPYLRQQTLWRAPMQADTS